MSIGLLVNYKKCGIGNGFAVGELSNDKYSVLTCKNGHELNNLFALIKDLFARVKY